MTYYCEHCGEEDEFQATQNYTEHGTETVYFDNDGGIHDTSHRQPVEFEEDNVLRDIECSNCRSAIADYGLCRRTSRSKGHRKLLLKKSKVTSWKERLR